MEESAQAPERYHVFNAKHQIDRKFNMFRCLNISKRANTSFVLLLLPMATGHHSNNVSMHPNYPISVISHVYIKLK